jgi:hypothetical protein
MNLWGNDIRETAKGLFFARVNFSFAYPTVQDHEPEVTLFSHYIREGQREAYNEISAEVEDYRLPQIRIHNEQHSISG